MNGPPLPPVVSKATSEAESEHEEASTRSA